MFLDRPPLPVVYASQNVGSATMPHGSRGGGIGYRIETETNHLMVKVRESLYGYVQENWLSWLWDAFGYRWMGPQRRPEPFASPEDFDVGEHITRFGDYPSAQRPFPYPYEIGAVSGFMPFLDQYSMAWAWGKNPSGPGVATPIPIPWMIAYPTMPKVTG